MTKASVPPGDERAARLRLTPAAAAQWARDYAAYLAVRAGIAALSMWSLSDVADGAEATGRLLARINPKRLARAESNLAVAFPDWDRQRLRATAIASHEHMIRMGLELAMTPRLLTEDGWPEHVETGDDLATGIRRLLAGGPCILLTGHCGNWEIMGYTLTLLGFPVHALYRPLDMPVLDRWVHNTRGRRGLTLVGKFGAFWQLPRLLKGGAPIAFVADQNAGDRALYVPYFNRLASTYKSIGLLAMRFGATILCGFARRMDHAPHGRDRLGYRIELTDVFGPEDWNQHPDPLFYLTARYRRGVEEMVRRAPGQYLWMHRIWRSRPRHERQQRPFPPALEEKIRLLPWITDADVVQIKDHSARDARTLAETGQNRLS